MTYSQTKIDETVLATLLLTLHDENRMSEWMHYELTKKIMLK